MILRQPVCITPRLMAGVKISDGSWIAIMYDVRPGRNGQTRYRYAIDLPDGTEYEGDDLQSGYPSGNLQQGLTSLLSFLTGCGHLFPRGVAVWVHQHSDELTMLTLTLEEQPNLIEEA